MLHEYELTVIVRSDLDDAVIYDLVDKLEAVVTDSGGNILLRDDWGKRKLAYPIQKQLKGHYFLISFLAQSAVVAELERRIRITDKIVRFMTVKVADAVDVDQRLEEAAVVRKQKEEEAKARAEAQARAEAEAEAAARAAQEVADLRDAAAEEPYEAPAS